MNEIRMMGIFLLLLASLGYASSIFYDDFSSYAVGSNISGQGGWSVHNCGMSCSIQTFDGRNQLYLRGSGVFSTPFRSFTFQNGSYAEVLMYTNPSDCFWIAMWNGSYSTGGDQGLEGEGYRGYMFCTAGQVHSLFMPPSSTLVNRNVTPVYTASRYYLLNMSWIGDRINITINGTPILNYTNYSYSSQAYFGIGAAPVTDVYVTYVKLVNGTLAPPPSVQTNMTLVSDVTGLNTNTIISEEPFSVYGTFISPDALGNANVTMNYTFNLTGQVVQFSQTNIMGTTIDFKSASFSYPVNATQEATLTIRTFYTNETINVTYNNTIIFNITRINVTVNCTNPTLNFSFYSQETPTTQSFSDMQAVFEIKYASTSAFNYSANVTNKTSFSLCLNGNYSNITIYSTQRFNGAGEYRDLYYYLVKSTPTPGITNNISLYNINNTNGVATKITVLTGNSQAVPGAYVQAIRKYPATNQYLTVSMLKADNNGIGSTYLIPLTTIYRFVVIDSDANILFTSDESTLTCDPSATLCEKTLLIDEGAPNPYSAYIGNIGVACTFTNTSTSGTIACTSDDPSGTGTMLTLDVFEVQAFSNVNVCHNLANSGSGTVFCANLNITKTYYYRATATIGEGTVLIGSGYVRATKPTASMGDSGLFFGMLLVLALGMMGVYGGAVGVMLGTAFGFGLSTLLGFFPFAVGTVSSVFMFALIVGWMMFGRRS